MVQLIITILAIVLTAASVLATVNYLPWWQKPAANSELAIRQALSRLETAYIASTRAAPVASFEPQATADGGLMTLFGANLGFSPATPPGYQWIYGKQMAAGGYSNTHYFCLTPDGSLPLRDESAYRAMLSARVGFSPAQYFLGTACGATANAALEGSTAVPVLTFYVKPIPDVGL